MAQEQDHRVAHGASNPNVPPPYPRDASSDQIRDDINRTRAAMDDTVDQLEERMRPRHILDDLLDVFRGSSGGQATSGAADKMKDAGSKIAGKLKNNPMPAALIGAGIAWLLFEDENKPRRQAQGPAYLTEPGMHSGSYVDARTGQPYSASYGEAYRGEAPAGGAEQPGMAEKAGEKASGAAESAKQTAASAGQKLSEWAGVARAGTSGAGQTMREYGSAASGQMRRGYDTSKHYLERGIEDYPLATGAAAMALGVLAGLLMPATRTEDKWMGQAADQAKDTAKEAGQSVASAAAGAASDEASKQGAHPGELGEKVKRVAEDVKRSATESAQREGLDPQSLKDKAKNVGERTKEAAKEESRRQSGQQPKP